MEIKKLFKDFSLTFILLSFATVFAYLFRVLLARNLSTEDFGLFYAVIAFFAFFGIFKSLGTTDSLVHFIPKYIQQRNLGKVKSSIEIVFYIQLLLGLSSAVIFFIFAKPIALHFFHTEKVTSLLQIQAVTYFITGLIDILVSIFRGYQKPVLAALYDPIRLVFILLISISLFYLGILTPLNLFLVWFVGYFVLLFLYSFIFIKDYLFILKAHAKQFASVYNDIKGYSLPLLLGIGAQLVFSRTDTLILTYFKGSIDVAFYEIVFPASQLLLLVVSPFLFVIFPMVSKFFFDKKKKFIGDTLQLSYNTGLFLLAPIALLLMIYPDLILKVFFSSKYIEAANALRIMTLGTFFLAFSNINLNILSGIGEIKQRTKILYLIALFNALADIALVPSLGYLGAIIATSASFFLLWLLSYVACVQDVPAFNPSLKAFLKIALSLVIFYLLVMFLKNMLHLNMYVEAIVVSVISLIVYLLFGLFGARVINLNLVKKVYGEMRR